MYGALDESMRKAERRLMRLKEKLSQRRRRPKRPELEPMEDSGLGRRCACTAAAFVRDAGN